MSFEVTFPGGVVVEATYAGHTVRTDQPAISGGTDSAMSPFGLFFASIATCMGFYALRFCRERDINTEGMGLTLTPVRNSQADRVTKVRIDLRLPREFPEKYRQAILRAVDHCAVKKHIVEAPEFEIEIAGAAVEVA
ncbi:MAG TPA: OsmC family protein [Thermoanaerobaculia bacterium]|nr:OsmC family protein [Thermoanaerobaculia bacterium]